MRMVVLALLIAGLTSGCAEITPRDNPPVAVWTSRSPLDATASCIVTELNVAMKTPSILIRPDFTHKVEITSPNETYEIAPQQMIIAAGEVYFARLHRVGTNATRIELYVLGNWAPIIKPPVEKCVRA